MDYRALIRRMRAAAENAATPNRFNLRIRYDEVDTLLASLRSLRVAAEKWRTQAPVTARALEKAEEEIIELRLENQRLHAQLTAWQRRQPSLLPDDCNRAKLDGWQQRVLQERG